MKQISTGRRRTIMAIFTENSASAIASALSEERRQIIETVRRWGNSNSDAVLDPSRRIFKIPSVDGLIGYRSEKGVAIVFGDPVCAPSDWMELSTAFESFCEAEKKSVIYLTASEQFTKWAMTHGSAGCIEFGEELMVNPQIDPRSKTGTNASLVRRKVKHALHEGAEVHEYLSPDNHLKEEIEQVGVKWLKTRRGPQLFLSHIRIFEDMVGKRIFYAKHGDSVIGVLLLHQLRSQNGWLLNHLMILPEAPHGTPELLVVTALEAARQEGENLVTFGSVPKAQLGEIVGLSKVSIWLANAVFKCITRTSHIDGPSKFWEKFLPESKPSYIVFSKKKISIKLILGLMRALNFSL